MSSIAILVVSLICFMAAYYVYGAYIEKKIFKASNTNPVPSEELRDDIDYVPTNKEVLFGHHFASIAGTGPIVGPAIAVIWGWLPALIWIIVGTIFAGAVHDYSALMMSVRDKGVSVGDICGKLINRRVKILFMLIILFALWVVVAIFGLVIAVIFKMYPAAVFPVWVQIPIAIGIGFLAYKKGLNITLLSVGAVILMYISIGIGMIMPIEMPSIGGIDAVTIWIALLFIYAYIASVLPVWQLLQPRDYINSHQLIIGIVLMVLGICLSRPEMVAPVFRIDPPGAPPLIPFLFIAIACGAISGFHALVGSGTTSKQIKKESDVRFIGYGGMLTEGFLGVLVLIAVGAGIGIYDKTSSGQVLTGVTAWQEHYSSWAQAEGLTAKVTAFVGGAANMIHAVGIPVKYGQALIGVMVASFAGTTLDTATRIQRYMIAELADDVGIKPLTRRHPATFAAVLAAALLAFAQGGGKGALLLWPLFGTSNQLLAGLVLLVAFVYVYKHGVNGLSMFLPMLFMIITSSWAMAVNFFRFMSQGQIHLVVIGAVFLFFEAWMIIEAVICLRHMRSKDRL